MKKIIPFAAVLAMHGTMLVAIPGFLLWAGPTWSAGAGAAPFRWIGTVLAACGILLYARTLTGLTVPGQGTPAIWDPPRFLVREGLYRIIRNPMYAAVVLIAMSEALISNRALVAAYAVALWGGFHLFVTLYEEPDLTKKFGTSYEDYLRSVPRWLPRNKKPRGT